MDRLQISNAGHPTGCKFGCIDHGRSRLHEHSLHRLDEHFRGHSRDFFVCSLHELDPGKPLLENFQILVFLFIFLLLLLPSEGLLLDVDTCSSLIDLNE